MQSQGGSHPCTTGENDTSSPTLAEPGRPRLLIPTLRHSALAMGKQIKQRTIKKAMTEILSRTGVLFFERLRDIILSRFLKSGFCERKAMLYNIGII
jgi:hypothetical protein